MSLYAECQMPENKADKWNSAIIMFKNDLFASPAVNMSWYFHIQGQETIPLWIEMHYFYLLRPSLIL